MAWPQTRLSTELAILIDGIWTDITPYLYAREGSGVSITYGIQNEGAQADPAGMSLELDNQDGRFTSKNPTSPYYGKFGRGTPIRFSVFEGDSYLSIPSSGNAQTPDNAAIDILGDIDIRIEAQFDSDLLLTSDPAAVPSDSIEVIAKDTSASRGWLLMVRGSRLYFEWSADGVNVLSATATEFVNLAPTQKIAFRVTLDVDNGAAGRTITFYKASSIAGPWTRVGSPVVQAGVTSIFNSTAPLRIGDATNFLFRIPDFKVYKAELRSGIAGSVVANPDFTAQAPGTTSFTDGAGRSWSTTGQGAITNRNVRFFGNVVAPPTRWQTGSLDAFVNLEAAGPLRRYGQGSAPLQSALRREFTNPTRTGIIEYWPMEEENLATKFRSGISGHASMLISGDISLSATDTYAPSFPLPTFGDGAAIGAVTPYFSTGNLSLKTFVQLTTPPGGTRSLLAMHTSGDISKWVLRVNATNQYSLEWYDTDDNLISSSGFATFFGANVPTSVVIELTPNGSLLTNWTLIVQDLRAPGVDSPINQLALSGTAVGSTGRVRRVRVGANNNDLGGITVGHVALANSLAAYANTGPALLAWRGEATAGRFRRVAFENEVPVKTFPGTFPNLDTDYKMGNQGELTLLGLYDECAEASNGLLLEDRSTNALVLRTGENLYSQAARFVLDYSGSDGLVTPLDPEEDDQQLVNDMTVRQVSGSEFRYQKTSGPLNIHDPEDDPQGVGVYEGSMDVDVWQPEQLEHFASWAVHVGTWDEWRFPKVTVYLQNDPTLVDEVTRSMPGDVFEITNMPSFAPPVDVRQMILGYSEFVNQYRWELTLNCKPGRPWDAGVVDSATLGRADTDGSVLAGAITNSATAMDVTTTNVNTPTWIDTAGFASQFPFDIEVGGERMTVTAVANFNTDTFSGTTANGWGTSESGIVWSASGGAAADYAEGGGIGTHTLPATSVAHRTFFTQTYPDAGAQVDITTSAAATGDVLTGGLTLRYTDLDNLYTARLSFSTTNTITLTLRKRVAAVETVLATHVLTLVHVPGTFVRLKFEVFGTTLRAKAWPATATDPEPGWLVTATDSSLGTSVFAGCRSISGAGNTNVNPVIRYDNYSLYNPQRFTVVRSVNGVVKAQAVNEPVNVFFPFIAGL